MIKNIHCVCTITFIATIFVLGMACVQKYLG